MDCDLGRGQTGNDKDGAWSAVTGFKVRRKGFSCRVQQAVAADNGMVSHASLSQPDPDAGLESAGRHEVGMDESNQIKKGDGGRKLGNNETHQLLFSFGEHLVRLLIGMDDLVTASSEGCKLGGPWRKALGNKVNGTRPGMQQEERRPRDLFEIMEKGCSQECEMGVRCHVGRFGCFGSGQDKLELGKVGVGSGQCLNKLSEAAKGGTRGGCVRLFWC